MSLKISVIICTHNPRADYLQHTLDALRAQSMAKEEWELLLIDNASQEPLAQGWDLSWHPQGRHVREEQMGLTPARLCGIREAQGELLIFVDDDNALAPDYLETAWAIAAEWPRVGVFGGCQTAVYEEPPAPDVQVYCDRHLALKNISRDFWVNVKGIWDATPFGAGLCVRHALAKAHAQSAGTDPLRKTLDRSGKTGMLCGGDIDLAWGVCDAGYGMLVTPRLTLKHYINKKRVTKAHLLRLIEGDMAGAIVVNHIHHLPSPKAGKIQLLRERIHIYRKMRSFDQQAALAALKGRVRGLQIIRENS